MHEPRAQEKLWSLRQFQPWSRGASVAGRSLAPTFLTVLVAISRTADTVRTGRVTPSLSRQSFAWAEAMTVQRRGVRAGGDAESGKAVAGMDDTIWIYLL